MNFCPTPSNILSTSPSASVEPPIHPCRTWKVIRPHVIFLNKLAAKHFPSLYNAPSEEDQQLLTTTQLLTTSLTTINAQIQEARRTANQAEENEDDDTEEQARCTLKTLKKEKKAIALQLDELATAMNDLTVSPSNTEGDKDETAAAAANPRVRAISNVVGRLIEVCNREDRKTKKEIFRVIRYHNCSQASTGGSKVDIELALPTHHVEWMTKVRMGCTHASVDKTLRILLEWYIAMCASDCMIEYDLLQGTEAVRPDMGGFAMGLSDNHENQLHQRGRRGKGEADRALREQYERNTPLLRGYGDEEAREFHQKTSNFSPDLQNILYKLGRGC